MNKLFSSSEILKEREKSTPVFSSAYSENEKYFHSLYITNHYKKLLEKLPVLEPNKMYDIVSKGDWSLIHVLFHVLAITGPAEVYATTYGLSPDVVRKIIEGKEKGLVKEFHFLFDWKIQTYKVEAYHLAASNFITKLTSIHAKVTVVLNENWGVTILGSANYTRNNKIENCIISTSMMRAKHHKKWILDETNKPNEVL